MQITETSIAGQSHVGATPSSRWITFLVRGEWFGVPVLSVREVLRDFSIERAPGAPPFVLGLINLRGEILTVVDGAIRLGMPVAAQARPDETDEDQRIVVVEHGDDVIGLFVDRVTDVLTLRADEIEISPEVGHGPRIRYIAGIAVRPAGLAFLLDVATLCCDAPETGAA